MVGLSLAKVNHILDGGERAELDIRIQMAQTRSLSQSHIDYLVSDAILTAWRPYSIVTRCKMFEEVFPDRLISYRRLRKLYTDHGISHRLLQIGMALTPAQLER